MRNFQVPGRSVAVGSGGAAATSNPLSTYLAIEVLRNGGNAVDAALSACSLQSVLEPHNTGIGGDCFAFIWRADQARVHAINGAGWAPAGLELEFLARAGLSAISPTSVHSVTVPGALSTWQKMLADHGTITLADMLRPTIEYAEHGIVLAERAAADWAAQVDKLSMNEGARQHLLFRGRAPSAGDIVRFPKLAQTLRTISAEGIDAFYQGGIGLDLVATLAGLGGRHGLNDFSEFQAHYAEPIGIDYHGYRVLQMPPSGQGLTALVMLNILAGFSDPAPDAIGAMRYHLQIEAARRAYQVRDTFVADPDYASVPVEELLSTSFAERLRSDIDPRRASPAGIAANVSMQRDTVCLTVVDGAGNACSIVNSLFEAFGSGIVCPRTGIILQNRGTGFRVQRGHPNAVAGRKRPLHTIIPGLVLLDGRPFLSFGVMGGAFQPVGQVQVLQNVVDYGMNVQQALDAPRGFQTGDIFEGELELPDAVLAELQSMGHRVGRTNAPFGGGQAIEIDKRKGTFTAGSDFRKDGCALAF